MNEGKKYVVYGMRLKCDQGTMENYLSTNKCELITPLPWLFPSEDHTIDGAPALTMESLCPCALGGVISIVPVVEEVVEDQEFEELKKELMDTISKEPWNIAKIHSLCIQLWGTETGNKIEADIFNMIKFAVSPTLAFEYVEKPENAADEDSEYYDYYRTSETYGVQRRAGFMDFYDHCGWLLGMDLDTEIIVFTPEGSDKEYRLQFWKGSYGGGGAFGGEIGFYERSVEEAKKNPYTEDNLKKVVAHFDCVSGEDEIPMKQEIYSTSGEPLIINDTREYAKDGDHYWNLAIKSDPGYDSEDLVIVNTLTIEDDSMREELAKEIDKNSNLTLLGIEGQDIKIQYGEFEDE